jgi:hypothetical protein
MVAQHSFCIPAWINQGELFFGLQLFFYGDKFDGILEFQKTLA